MTGVESVAARKGTTRNVQATGATRGGAHAFWRFWSSAGMLVVLLALLIGVSIFVPSFLSFVNLKGLLLAVSTVGMIACTMLFCLAAGDFDLSVGSVVAMAGVLAAVTINRTG